MLPIVTPVIAFLLPILLIWIEKTEKHLKYPFLFTIGSFISCCITCVAQLVVIRRRAFAGDFAGLEDTMNETASSTAFLIPFLTIMGLAPAAMFFKPSWINA